MTGLTMTVEARLRRARDSGRKLLIPYVTGGITPDWTSYVLALQAAGADAIEVGLPFSDPMLDGVTIQEASDRALARGATVPQILADLAGIRTALTVPIVAMTYANLVLRPGPDAFCESLRAAGVSGLIVPDLPLDEMTPVEQAAERAGIELVLLAAPSSTPARLREICARSRGYVYAITVMGTTGERAELSSSAGLLAASVRDLTDRPVVLGFGISSAAQAREASALADGVVVASALMRRVLDGATADQVGGELAGLRRSVDGADRHAGAAQT
jgi:tryptophan synthase alpha chain